jgi:hypothetical protein
MRLGLLISIFALAVAPLAAAPLADAAPKPHKPSAPQPPVAEVMIVGVYHMSNPGRDLHNIAVDDVLTPRRQAEIAAAIAGLARFRPTKVATEWPADIVAERYPKYLAGTLAPSRNEVVQLGFRLAKTAGAQGVWGIDADGDFPYEPVQTYAKAHGQSALLDEQGAATDRMVREVEGVLATRNGTAAALRYINDPTRVAASNSSYRTMLRVGAAQDQPGVDLLTAWYRRNFLICANLVQLTRPGDRVVVFYGFGHDFLLRQCVRETPGLKLVEPNAYLPK